MIEKIDGLGNIRTPQPVKRTTKTRAGDATSFAGHLGESEETSATTSVASTADLSAILGAQEVDDALSRASRGKKRGDDILDRLDELKLDILSGTLSPERLTELSQSVAVRRAEVDDPRLVEILDAIDLRAQVELAKYTNT